MGVKAKAKGFSGWWMISLLSAASLVAAGSDLRLVEAVKNRDQEAVRSLLQQQTDVNTPQADGATALAWAAHWDDLETADLLIRAGANANAANDYGITALSLACTNRNAAMVEKLLQAGANPNAAQWTGETALMTCARTGNVDAVKSLLAHGADVTAKDARHGQTALMWAVAQKHPEVARALIEHGADVHAKSHRLAGYTPLLHQTYKLTEHVTGKPDTFDATDVHADPASPKGDFTPLLFAARVGDLDSARILVTAGADVKEATPESGSALVVASASGHEKLALFLLEKGADPNAADGYGIAALHYAVQEGIPAIGCARSLPTDRSWYHPNMPELVKALLARGANPNAPIGKGYPPFDYPPFSRSCGILMPQIRQVGATPFFLAAAAGDVSLLRVLLAKGADPRLATQEGTTPLMVAAGLGRANDRTEEEEKSALEATILLVELGADVNAAAAFGRTALHGAAYIGANTIIQFLVDKGAKIDAKDKYGETPLNVAEGDPWRLVDRLDKRFRQAPVHKSTAELLLKLGATPLTAPAARGPEAASANPGK